MRHDMDQIDREVAVREMDDRRATRARLRGLPVAVMAAAIAIGVMGPAGAAEKAADFKSTSLSDVVAGFVFGLAHSDDELVSRMLCLDLQTDQTVTRARVLGLVDDADFDAVAEKYRIAYLAAVHDKFGAAALASSTIRGLDLSKVRDADSISRRKVEMEMGRGRNDIAGLGVVGFYFAGSPEMVTIPVRGIGHVWCLNPVNVALPEVE